MSETKTEIAARVIESVSAKATYTGAGTAIVFGYKAADFAAIAGVIIGIIGLAINTYYKHKTFKLDQKKKACEHKTESEG